MGIIVSSNAKKGYGIVLAFTSLIMNDYSTVGIFINKPNNLISSYVWLHGSWHAQIGKFLPFWSFVMII